MTKEEEAFNERLVTRIDVPISRILMGFEDFNKVALEVMKSHEWTDEGKEEIVSIKKELMDLELRLRKVMNDPYKKEEHKSSSANRSHPAPSGYMFATGDGTGSSPEFEDRKDGTGDIPE